MVYTTLSVGRLLIKLKPILTPGQPCNIYIYIYIYYNYIYNYITGQCSVVKFAKENFPTEEESMYEKKWGSKNSMGDTFDVSFL